MPGYEFNPYNSVLHDDKVISVNLEEDGRIVVTHLRGEYVQITDRKDDVSYNRVDMKLFYDLLAGSRLRVPFSQYMLDDNFVFKGVGEIEEAVHHGNLGKLIRDSPPYLVACSYYYDYGAQAYITYNGRVYIMILDVSNKPVDLMNTPYVLSTRRRILRELRGEVGELSETIDGMEDPVMVNEVSCNAYFISDTEIKRYSRLDIYHDDKDIIRRIIVHGRDIQVFDARGIIEGYRAKDFVLESGNFFKEKTGRRRRGKRILLTLERDKLENFYCDQRDGLLRVWYEEAKGPFRFKNMQVTGKYGTGIHPKRKKKDGNFEILVLGAYGVMGVSAIRLTCSEAMKLRPVKEVDDRYVYQKIYTREGYDKERKDVAALHYVPSYEDVRLVRARYKDDI